jgi:uncharacterized protein
VRLLIVFAKSPDSGKVKTRIGEAVGPDQAAIIYKHMLQAAVAASAPNALWTQVIAITPESDAAYFTHQGLKVVRQRGEGIGRRMSNALADGFRSGAGQVILIGSDIPSLTSAEIAAAFFRLDSAAAVIGPSEDGGFYLFGVNAGHRRGAVRVMQDAVDWSSPRVYSQVETLCRKYSLPLERLPAKRDIDTYEDWLDYQSVRSRGEQS